MLIEIQNAAGRPLRLMESTSEGEGLAQAFRDKVPGAVRALVLTTAEAAQRHPGAELRPVELREQGSSTLDESHLALEELFVTMGRSPMDAALAAAGRDGHRCFEVRRAAAIGRTVEPQTTDAERALSEALAGLGIAPGAGVR